MHPDVRKDAPGMCPECGMSLVEVRIDADKERINRDRHRGHHENIFRTKFWVSLVLSIPLILYSDAVTAFFHWNPPVFPDLVLLEFVLASVVFFYGGWVFLASAWREIRGKLPGMMTLISIAITTAYAWSAYGVVTGRNDMLFWELSTLITIMLLGHWLEMRAVKNAQGALGELSKLLPDTAEIVVTSNQQQVTKTIPLAELKEGDVILVKPGGKVAADGEVIEGESSVDESIATGESKPVSKGKGDGVIAGTVNGDGVLKIKVTEIGEHTFLAGVARLVKEAQASKSHLQILSDRAAFYLTFVAVGAGAVTVVLWIASGAGTAFAIERLVAVLVIACPHALGLAVPLVASISTTKAAKNGFIVKQRIALEAARNIDIVLFDKTGTLTKGEYGVTEIISHDHPSVGEPISKDEILKLAASVDANSEHPIAKAIVAEAKKRGLRLETVDDFRRSPGKGASAKNSNEAAKRIFIGGENMLADFPGNTLQVTGKGNETVIYVANGESIVGAITLADVIREESREAIKTLKDMNVEVAMVTGDANDVAKWVAEELGIKEYFAKVMPSEKSEKVKLLQSKGKRVAMVGDGVNDAPALTQADLGIAIGAGTNVAIESAGIILVKNDPRDIPKIITLSRLTYAKMIQNLWWAAGYNIIAIPLAAGVLAGEGVLLSPAFGAVLMSLSTVIVAGNAMLLRRRKL